MRWSVDFHYNERWEHFTYFVKGASRPGMPPCGERFKSTGCCMAQASSELIVVALCNQLLYYDCDIRSSSLQSKFDCDCWSNLGQWPILYSGIIQRCLQCDYTACWYHERADDSERAKGVCLRLAMRLLENTSCHGSLVDSLETAAQREGTTDLSAYVHSHLGPHFTYTHYKFYSVTIS